MAGLLWLSACGQKQDAVIRPLVQQITESVYAPGVVKSRNQYEVFSTVPGIVAQIQVREGDTVGRGDVLMRLRSETQQLSALLYIRAAGHASIKYENINLPICVCSDADAKNVSYQRGEGHSDGAPDNDPEHGFADA